MVAITGGELAPRFGRFANLAIANAEANYDRWRQERAHPPTSDLENLEAFAVARAAAAAGLPFAAILGRLES